MKYVCMEYSGEMKMKEDVFEAAALVSKQHSYLYAMDYDFMNIQPIVKNTGSFWAGEPRPTTMKTPM